MKETNDDMNAKGKTENIFDAMNAMQGQDPTERRLLGYTQYWKTRQGEENVNELFLSCETLQATHHYVPSCVPIQ